MSASQGLRPGVLQGAAVPVAAVLGIGAALFLAPDRHAPQGFAPDTDRSGRTMLPHPFTFLPLLHDRASECDGGDGSGGTTPPRPATSPQTWVLTEDYPLSALISNRQGRMSFSLLIDAGGGVVSCNIIRSSGTPSLDGAGCLALDRRARFEPARDGSGCPVPSRYNNSIVWQIPQN